MKKRYILWNKEKEKPNEDTETLKLKDNWGLVSSVKQEKIKVIKIAKEQIKLSLVTDDMIVCRKFQRIYKKFLELI